MNKYKFEYDILFLINTLFIVTVTSKIFVVSNFRFLYTLGIVFLILIIRWISNKFFKFWQRLLVFFTAAIGVFTYFVFRKEQFLNFINYIANIVIKFNDNIYNAVPTNFNEIKLLLIGVILIEAIINFIFMDLNIPEIIPITTVSIILYFYYFGFKQRMDKYLFPFICLGVFLYLSIIYLRYNKFKVTKGKLSYLNRIQMYAYIIAVSFIVTFGGFYINRSTSLGFLKSGIVNISSNFLDKFQGEGAGGKKRISSYNSDIYYGFSGGKKKLGGSMTLDDKLMFRVKSNKTYYLRAIVKDYYDGASWDTTEKDYTPYKLPIDYSNSIKSYSEGIDQIIIYPENIYDKSLFVPKYTYDISGIDRVYFNKDNLTFLSKDYVKNSYTASFFISDSLSRHMLPQASTYKNFKDYLDNKGTVKNLSEEDYKIVEKYKRYLQLPESVPKRLYTLVDGITQQSTAIGSIYIIRNYIRNNFKYSLEVSEIPQGQDFVDHFINVEKKGYCTYFATAATIFYRMRGIPARYVEGFTMNGSNYKDGMYEVTNKQAHAWCEVLVQPSKDIWETIDCVPEAPTLTSQQMEAKSKEILQKQEEAKQEQKKQEEKKVEEQKKEEKAPTQDLKQKKVMTNYIISVVIVLLIITALLIKLLVINKIRRKNILQSENIKPLYKYYRKNLKVLGYDINKNITELELAESITDKELGKMFKDIVEELYKQHYGNLRDNGINKEHYYDYIENYVKNQEGRLKFFIYKLIH